MGREQHYVGLHYRTKFQIGATNATYGEDDYFDGSDQKFQFSHPKPFDRVAPAGRSTPATRHKAPRPRQRASGGFRIFYAMCNCSFNARCKT